MNITPSITGAPEAIALLQAMGKNAQPATRLWANLVGEHMQRAMRREIPRRFHMRNTTAQFERAIVFLRAKSTMTGAADAGFVTKEVQAVLKVGGDGVGRTATNRMGQILARHEDGGSRTSNMAYRGSNGMIHGGFFLPAKGMRTNNQNPPRSTYPRNIGALIRIDPSGKLFYSKSQKGSYKRGTQVSYFATEKGIFRRKQSAFGNASADVVWWFKKRIRSPARLRMWETAQAIMDRHGMGYADDAIDLLLSRMG